MKMPKEMKAAWLEALRSGEYKQTPGTLHNEGTGGYCCLGVLECVVDGEVERYENGNPRATPTAHWWSLHGVDPDHGLIRTLMIKNDGEWFNDQIVGQHSFAEIADYIEEHIEGV